MQTLLSWRNTHMAWEIDPAHSEAQFAVKHMMFTTVRGHFNVLSGHLHIDEQHPENSWVDAQVDAGSVDTRSDYNVLGDLTLHGVTKPVLFKAEYAGQAKTPFGKTIAGLSAKTKINRKDFGL